ncbi:MAG: hypothetical protein AAFV45_04995 [Pseudomonadota bacterium]
MASLANLATALAHQVNKAPLVIVAGPVEGRYASLTHATRSGVQAAITACQNWTTNLKSASRLSHCARVETVAHACETGRDGADGFDEKLLQIIARKPQLVIGHPCDQAALKAAEAYQETGIPFVAVGVRDPGFWASGGVATRHAIGANRNDESGALLLQALRGIQSKDGECFLAIAHDQTRRNRARLRQLNSRIERLDVEGMQCDRVNVVRTLRIKASQLSYDRGAAALTKSAPDAILLLTSPIEGGSLIRSLAAIGYTGRVVGPPEWIAEEIWSTGQPRTDRRAIEIASALPLFTPFSERLRDNQAFATLPSVKQRVQKAIEAWLNKDRNGHRGLSENEIPNADELELEMTSKSNWAGLLQCDGVWSANGCATENHHPDEYKAPAPIK